MTNKHAQDAGEKLLPCPIPGCKDNLVRTGYEGNSMMHKVYCTSPEHVLYVFGNTEDHAKERWNSIPRAQPAPADDAVREAVDAIKEYTSGALPYMKHHVQTLIRAAAAAPKVTGEGVVIGYESFSERAAIPYHDDDSLLAAIKTSMFGSIDNASEHEDECKEVFDALKSDGLYEFEAGRIYTVPFSYAPTPEAAGEKQGGE